MTFDFLDGPDCDYNDIPDYLRPVNCDGSPWYADFSGNAQLGDGDPIQTASNGCNGSGAPGECKRHGGNLNCDGSVNSGDINPFMLLMTNYRVHLATFPDCLAINGAINIDGQISFADINSFVALLASL
jgi:hypothetical protein